MFSVSVNGDRGEGRVKSSGLDTFLRQYWWNISGGNLIVLRILNIWEWSLDIRYERIHKILIMYNKFYVSLIIEN